jgi:Spy/CpxP family protein refolding chaperone
MRTWIKRTLIGLLGAAVLVGGIVACSHRHHGWGGEHWSAQDSAEWRERLLERAGKELQLDAAQSAALSAVFDRMQEQRNALMAGNATPRDELRALVATERFDRARAQAWVDQKTDVMRSQTPQTIDALAAFYDGLKPEQQARLREFMNRRGHRGGRS